jgi:transcriptional regulator with GAF, ATPase, and Fis domain
LAIPGDDPRLDVDRAPGGQAPGEPAREADASDEAADPSFPTLDEAMRRHIEAALVRCNGRIEGERGAARLLAIHANTLRSRMHRLGIRWERFR